MTRTLEIARLPADALHLTAGCYIVVDLLRATTTIATLFSAGIESLLVTGDIELARARSRSEGRLLLGEVNGLRPTGFDFGNSPLDAADAEVAGRDGVLFTTNGTAALCTLAGRATVVAGALANLQAVAAFAVGFEHVLAVCAGNGRGTEFSPEDFAASGAIAATVAALDPDRALGGQARLAMALDAAGEIAAAPHAALLTKLGLAADVEFCLRPDTSQAVPVVAESGDGWAVLRDSARARA